MTGTGHGARRDLHAARQRLRGRELYRRGEVECWAGEPVALSRDGSPGCYCNVTLSMVSERADPGSLAKFCMGEFRVCPVWHAEKQRLEERRGRLVSSERGQRRQQRELAAVGGEQDALLRVVR